MTPTRAPAFHAGHTLACMGGWCAQREHCMHYHAADRSAPAERLCLPGADGFALAAPVRVMRQPGEGAQP